MLVALAVTALVGCGPTAAPSGAVPPTEPASAVGAPSAPATADREDPFVRRPYAVRVDDQPVLAGVSYGPYREGQRPGGPDPTVAQIEEDLRILAPDWHAIRVYSSRGPAEDVLRTIREHRLPIKVLVGAWIGPQDAAANKAEVEAAIHLANTYPDVVLGVNVGNETQVEWSAHRAPMDELIGHIRAVRAAVAQPVTTADDYNFWNKPHSHAVADEVDFLLLHAYAMWNGKTLDDAVPWTAATVATIQAEHPDLVVVIGETGWATELNPDGDEGAHIKAPAGALEQRRFFVEFTRWAAGAAMPYFYFEAFDEPWNGSSDPREVEKHWGLYRVDRTPKPALHE